MDKEFSRIRDLVVPGRRRREKAKARIRPYLIMESVLGGRYEQPTDARASRVIKRMKRGEDWQAIFPGVATLRLDTTGHGLTLSVRFTRQSGAAPVRIVREGEDAEDAALIREVDLLDRYSMGLYDLADKAGIGRHKTLALVYYLRLQADAECFKEFHHKSLRYKGYSPKALQRIQEALPSVDLDQIWRDYVIAKRQQSRV